ncbi:unnamed protein product [Oncorhynchus mykiss]|uniref:Phosphatidic acid phosphatase type 2/haloperoxidase domain-containing protein n=1 Tax=Oncorhynchus mykiss TaxID=8022 RepID=A0A060YCV2_ONCMY|nr:unnamed protein product [Oncorhynchus mykiss]
MLYFQLVIMAGTVMLAYYFEYTDTFNVHVQGFFCYDNAYTKPYLGPEASSAVPPAILYAVVCGVPSLLVSFGKWTNVWISKAYVNGHTDCIEMNNTNVKL